MAHAVDEALRQSALVDELQEGPLDVGIGDDELAEDLFTIGQYRACRLAAMGHDLRDIRARADCAARCLEGGGERRRHCAHAAAGIAPGADRSVDLAHVVMQEHIGRSR
ncbi:hypothetical protein D3C72_2131970 [compost metagenome]